MPEDSESSFWRRRSLWWTSRATWPRRWVHLRRDTWSVRLPLSILKDLEEFAVYDCRFEFDKGDSASAARLKFFTYDRYAEPSVWVRISSIFSRGAVLAGSLERCTETNRRKRGTETVDAAFLHEIEGWRNALARDLALHGLGLNGCHLNYAAHMTIDYIIFLRMADDRGIEEYGWLMALLNGNDVYGRLCELFSRPMTARTQANYSHGPHC